MARLYAKLASLMLFRWGGEYTWVATGPYSTGVSEPIPLPTTIIGALLGTKRGAELDENEVLKAISARVGCRVDALRGPYYPVGDAGIAVHVYPGSLAVIDGEGRVESVVSVSLARHHGTALRYEAKVVSRGMLYKATMLDPAWLQFNAGAAITPELSVDLVGCECREPKLLGLAKLGGDMRIAAMSIDRGERLTSLLKRVVEEDETSYYIVASPLLIPEDDASKARDLASRLQRGEEVRIGECRMQAATAKEAQKLAPKYAKKLRVRVELLHPGVYGDTGFSRRPTLAILPGSLVKCSCSVEALKQGVGQYSRLGFGTLVPVKPR